MGEIIFKNWSREGLQPLGTGPWAQLSPDSLPGHPVPGWAVPPGSSRLLPPSSQDAVCDCSAQSLASCFARPSRSAVRHSPSKCRLHPSECAWGGEERAAPPSEWQSSRAPHLNQPSPWTAKGNPRRGDEVRGPRPLHLSPRRASSCTTTAEELSHPGKAGPPADCWVAISDFPGEGSEWEKDQNWASEASPERSRGSWSVGSWSLGHKGEPCLVLATPTSQRSQGKDTLPAMPLREKGSQRRSLPTTSLFMGRKHQWEEQALL